jgi:prophage tail gpP-like protein
MKITIGTRELTTLSSSITVAMDNASDAFECSIPWLPGEDPELDELIKPRSFTPATAKINDELLVRGLLFIRSPNLGNDGSTLDMQFFSQTKNIIDCQAKPPYEFQNKSLISIANELAQPFGIQAFSEDDGEASELFDREAIEPTETIFIFLNNLARQRGILLSNTVDGDILFLKAKTTGTPVASITEGDLQGGNVETGQTFSASFDDTKTFQIYRALGETPLSFLEPVNATAINSNIKIARRRSFTATDETKGGIEKAADWEKNTSLADSLTIPFPVTTWYDKNGELWKTNSLVTVTSPTIFVPKGFNFMIRSIQFIQDGAGDTAVLNLIPPQLYTKEDIPEPWV